jgi:hypothetical protein
VTEVVGRIETVVKKRWWSGRKQGRREVHDEYLYKYELWRTIALDFVGINRICYSPIVALSQSHQ